jgi:putative sporulation protein YtxC
LVLVRIHFQSDTEALKLLEYVSVHPLGTELNEYIQFTPDYGLSITIKESYAAKLLSLASDVFYSFLLEEKLRSWQETILRNKFFYREREEIDAIIEIAYSIIEGEQKGDKEQLFQKEKKMIYEGLQSFFAEKKSFSFDSFATFRLKSFYDSLYVYVEAAIDEYKLEQEYQSFIAALRDLLYKGETKMEIIHLLHNNSFSFFDENFKELDKYEIYKLIDKKLLIENPIYIDSKVLAPLISIAPKRLNLYTNETEDGLIQTITRIFEERTAILPVNSFRKNRP